MPGPEDRNAGFTLLETVVVLAIAALIFSVGALSLANLKGRMTPEKVAGEIARLANAVHAAARDGAKARSVVVDLKAKRVATPDGDRVVQIPAGYSLSVVVGRETISNEAALEIHFLPDGTSSGAEILIGNAENQKARVDINWLTGLARVQDGQR